MRSTQIHRPLFPKLLGAVAEVKTELSVQIPGANRNSAMDAVVTHGSRTSPATEHALTSQLANTSDVRANCECASHDVIGRHARDGAALTSRAALLVLPIAQTIAVCIRPVAYTYLITPVHSHILIPKSPYRR